MFDMYQEVKLTELPELVKKLSEAGITFDACGNLGGINFQIPSREAFNKGEKCAISVACHNGSYGHEKGLFEVYAPQLNVGVEGWLNAEETFEYIQDTLKGILRGSIG